MSFYLRLSSETKELNFKNPTEEDITHAILTLKKNPENFLILDSTEPIDTFNFIQASGFENNTFYVEAQYGEGNALYIYGNHTVTENTLLTILIDFISNKAPNINEWEYIQDVADYKFFYEHEFRKITREKGLFAIKCDNAPANRIVLDTSDLQVFLNYVKQNSLNTVLYYYGYMDNDKYDIYGAVRKKDYDLMNIAREDISEYENKMSSIDINRPAYLIAYCLHNGFAILIKIVAPWMRALVSADEYVETLEIKYSEKLYALKSQRENSKDLLKEQLREKLLRNTEFHLCTNQKLRYDFMRRFLLNTENNKYKEAFLTNSGGLDSYALQAYADTIYAVYKQSLRKK